MYQDKPSSAFCALIFAAHLLAAPSPAAAPRPIAITVDDLPLSGASRHPDFADRERLTRALLAALQKHHIRAVGLVTWRNVHEPEDRKLLELWLAAGHELGNHSLSHLNHSETDSATYLADLEKGREALARYLGARQPVRFFRFPFLAEGDTLEKLRAARRYLADSKQRNLTVTIDDQDWSFDEPFSKAQTAGDARALADVRDAYRSALHSDVRFFEERGDRLVGRMTPQILLLHATAVSASEWDDLFAWLEQTGHRFATVDEVLADPALSLPHEYVGPNGPSFWERVRDDRKRQEAVQEVTALLKTQAEAWNRGDLPAFCASYADDARFLSPTGVTQGRGQLLARYAARYPSRAAMGTLTLAPIEMRLAKGTEFSLFGDALPSRVHAIAVAARWTLAYPDKPAATGVTLLVLQRGRDGWMIVEDASM